ncbi:sulfite exporter TauE/SafE family protein [Devosia sp.]|uniref:sulfite exporter TauE/SafE family protein n=1 Tax=Devosia sp. TaxID=1871048 RepID=UPI001AD2A714|nr:sulfite exporter TauE/SafE family protein [Devosia sp.]MBN9309445.1 sulfite exporter TauE/SafE family protein [Devosia sp.]
MTELLLVLAGLFAGALNTLAGGGSFVLFPALLAAGIPPVIANATNTFASLPGYASGAVGFWSDIVRHRERLLAYSIVGLVFGYAGAELLLHVSNQAFVLVVPWLMLFAVVLFAFGARINAFVRLRAGSGGRRQRAGAIGLVLLLAAISLYGGFFNAGLGVLLLAFLALAGFTDIHAMNGLKLWISTVVALAGVARFALSGAIDWYHGAFALAGIVVGAYGAARLAKRVPTPIIRTLVIVYGIGLTGWFFWSAYFG